MGIYTFPTVFIVYNSSIYHINKMMKCGGFNDFKPATDEVQQLCNEVKNDIAAKHGPFTFFEVIEFKTQVVAGTNYHVKIKIEDDKQIEVVIFKALPYHGGKVELSKFL